MRAPRPELSKDTLTAPKQPQTFTQRALLIQQQKPSDERRTLRRNARQPRDVCGISKSGGDNFHTTEKVLW